jgi:hypothetical protein
MNGVAHNKHTPSGERPGCMEAQAREQHNLFSAADAAYERLKRELLDEERMGMTHREVEDYALVQSRELMRLMVQDQFRYRGLRVVTEPVIGADGIERTHERERPRGLQTIFGEVDLSRLCHGQRGVDSLAVVDAELSLPREFYSLGLRRLVAREAAKVSFDAVVEAVKTTTGVDIPKRQVEQLAMRAAEHMEAFYEHRRAAANEGTGEYVVITTDGKGVSMRREDLRPATRKAAEKRRPKRKKRRSKGEKGMTRRMAQVASVYTVEPHVRAAEDIVQELRPSAQEAGPRPPRPKPEGKRVWASVVHDAATVIAQAFQEAAKRDPERKKRWVVLVDGAEHQLACVKRCIRKTGVDAVVIVDIIHVIEYLWGAANAFFGEGENPAGEFQDSCRLVIQACFALDFEEALSYSGLRQTTRTGFPVAGLSGPALRVAPASGFVDAATGREDFEVTAEVSVVGGHEVDRAVEVFGVVPLDEASDPGEGGVDVHEGARREVGAVLEGPEEGFRVGVVVADAGAAEGGRDAELLQLGQERGALHGSAVVRVQPEDIITPRIGSTNSFDERRGEVPRFDVVDRPADDAAAPDIDDQVQVEVDPADAAAQVRDVPRVDLVGSGGREGLRAARGRP